MLTISLLCLYCIQDVDLHDAAYFRLARAEATAIDPQTRLLLQVCTEATVDASDALASLGKDYKKSTGVYVGCMFVDYIPLLKGAYGIPSTGNVMTGRLTCDT